MELTRQSSPRDQGFTDPSDNIVTLRGVHKSFGAHHVLQNINMDIRQGEMVAITGASGSGKSTILNIIGLLDVADSGEVSLFGHKSPSFGSRAATRLLRDRIGYLFQNAALIDQDSVDANLKIAQPGLKSATAKAKTARGAALAAVGLNGMEHRKVFELSGGEQQRLALSRLLLRSCDLILADEPTGSLDSANRDRMVALLADLHRMGRTILLVTHDPVVASAAERIITLDPS